AAAATTSASMRRSTVMRSRATDGMSASECQGKRPDQAVKHRPDGRECREPSTLSHLASSQFRKRLPSMSVQGSSGESRPRQSRKSLQFAPSEFIRGMPDESLGAEANDQLCLLCDKCHSEVHSQFESNIMYATEKVIAEKHQAKEDAGFMQR